MGNTTLVSKFEKMLENSIDSVLEIKMLKSTKIKDLIISEELEDLILSANHRISDQKRIIQKMKTENFKMTSYLIDQIKEAFNVEISDDSGLSLILNLSNIELELFTFGMLQSLRGDWSDVTERTNAFRIATAEFLKRTGAVISPEKKEIMLDMKDDVIWFENNTYRDGRCFREKAPYGYYGVYEYVGLPNDFKISDKLSEALSHYCQYYDEKNLAAAFSMDYS